MKTKEQIQAVVNEILEVCERHGVVLSGTCEAEGIYGEIAIGNAEDKDSHALGWNIVVGNSVDGFSVRGIGRPEDVESHVTSYVPITHGGIDRCWKLCRCSCCGATETCTPMNDYYTYDGKDDGPLLCESCMWNVFRQTQKVT